MNCNRSSKELQDMFRREMNYVKMENRKCQRMFNATLMTRLRQCGLEINSGDSHFPTCGYLKLRSTTERPQLVKMLIYHSSRRIITKMNDCVLNCEMNMYNSMTFFWLPTKNEYNSMYSLWLEIIHFFSSWSGQELFCTTSYIYLYTCMWVCMCECVCVCVCHYHFIGNCSCLSGSKWRHANKRSRLKQIYFNNRTNILNTGVLPDGFQSFPRVLVQSEKQIILSQIELGSLIPFPVTITLSMSFF